MNIVRNSKGFTLIEIVIVIAIAALILAAVLIFVPQVQASQRDSQRRSAVGKILAKEAECASTANSGATCSIAQMNGSYMTNITQPGSALTYTAVAGPLAAPPCATSGNAVYQQNVPNTGSVTVSICLEGSKTWYTQNN